jgi:hypothetical protein
MSTNLHTTKVFVYSELYIRGILRRIYGPIKENSILRSRYNHEIYKLYNEPDTVTVIKVERWRWLGHPFSMQEENSFRKLTVRKQEGP